MQLILFCMNPEGSPHFASFKIARELEAAGYRVVYCGFRFFETMVRMQGLEYLPIDEGDDPENIPQHFAATDDEINERFSRFMEKWLDTHTAHLAIICNIRLLDFAIPFRRRNIPVIGFCSNLSSCFSLQYPPVTSHLAYRAAMPWVAGMQHLREWAKQYFAFPRMHFRMWQKARRFRKQFGAGFHFGEYGYKLKVPNLLVMVEDFNLPWVQPAGNDCYVGVQVDAERVEGRPVAWQTNRPLIYCSLGTHRYVEEKYIIRFFNAVIEAIRQRPQFQLLLHVRQEEMALIHDTSADGNIRVMNWVPQLDVLSRSALFITHGGLGSVRESLYMGVPMIVYPLAVDQPGNAARVLYHGLGLRGNIRKTDAARIGALIDRVSSEPSFTLAARRMRQICREKDDTGKLIKFVQDVLHEAAPVQPAITTS